MKKILLLMLVIATFAGCQKKDEVKNAPSSIANSVWKTRVMPSNNSSVNTLVSMTLIFKENKKVEINILSEIYQGSITIIPREGIYDYYDDATGYVSISEYAFALGTILFEGELYDYRVSEGVFYFKKPYEDRWHKNEQVDTAVFEQGLYGKIKVENDRLYMDDVEYIRQ